MMYPFDKGQEDYMIYDLVSKSISNWDIKMLRGASTF